MQMQPFALFQCWNGERIGEVINKEAASVDTATFLATHVPLNKLTYHRVPQSISDTSENGLLQELRRCAEQDKHAFVVVQGIPGTGKSHLIRWLKERYETEADRQHEQVLFIERAQCSLRSTLEQIIKSPVFDKETMKEQLEKLNGARIELSREALSHTLLSQLQVAIGEMPQVEMPRWLARNSRLEKFLLDFVVRQELMKAGGPIDRIVRFLRVCIERGQSGSCTGEPRDHEPGHGKVDKSLTAGVRALKIAREPTVVRDPGIGPFDDPSSGKHVEAFGHDLVPINLSILRSPDPAPASPPMFDHFETDTQVFLHPLLEGLAVVTAIHPDQLEARQLAEKKSEQHFGSFSVADRSFQHFHFQEQSQRVYQQVSFSALNFFAPIIATRITAHGTGFDRLAVQNSGARFRLAPKIDAYFPSQGGVDLLPDACLFPFAEIEVNRTPIGQIMWKHTPRTPAAQHRQDPIDNFSPLNFLRSSSRLGGRDQRFQDRPFLVCYI
jgi:hypothetical protein